MSQQLLRSPMTLLVCFLGGLMVPHKLIAQTAIREIPLDADKQSAASQWVSEALLAVSSPEGSSLGPTGASRAYAILGTAMFDAWSAYQPQPGSTVLGDTLQQPFQANTLANKSEAVSYAAFTVLSDLFPDPTSVESFRSRMTHLGFNPDTPSTTAANIGITMANELLAIRRADGSNQVDGYADTSGYLPVNSAADIPNSLSVMDRWTPENVPIDSLPGDADHLRVQSPLTPHWGSVTPFALTSAELYPLADPEPFLLDPQAVADLSAGTITRADNTVVAISKDLIGIDINPRFIEQAIEVVEFSASLSPPPANELPGGEIEGETRKLIAEFWEDPAGTPYPPGTWMFFAQKVGERENPDLDTDVPLFFAVGNAVLDAGIASWEAKYQTDYVRPVRAVRELGRLGLIGEPNSDGEFEIEAWAGPGFGTQSILATEFLSYQTPGGDPSPPFPEFTSGHSTFSAAAAEVLRLMTGSDAFLLGDGTLGLSVAFQPGDSRFEPGITPTQEIVLNWPTFSAAADEAGISRLYGGIHFQDGDLEGRALGRSVGAAVFEKVQFFQTSGVVIPEPATLVYVACGGLAVVARRRGT